MSEELIILLVGWVLGVFSSMAISLLQYWLEGKRQVGREETVQRREDIRLARNWADEGKAGSLRGFDLRGANLAGKDLVGADLEDANLEGANLYGARFCEANLINANLRRTRAIKAKFTDANLHGADFTGATIQQADFSGTRLRRTRLSGAQLLTECRWENAEIDETTELPNQLSSELRGTPAENADPNLGTNHHG